MDRRHPGPSLLRKVKVPGWIDAGAKQRASIVRPDTLPLGQSDKRDAITPEQRSQNGGYFDDEREASSQANVQP